ncbi:MAG: protein kinase [Planctomycetes bacterium]|nr:protein kinase [Planctomycetota bacterium]
MEKCPHCGRALGPDTAINPSPLPAATGEAHGPTVLGDTLVATGSTLSPAPPLPQMPALSAAPGAAAPDPVRTGPDAPTLEASALPFAEARSPTVLGLAGAPASRIGDYVLVRELGRGGMGVVYEALQPSLNRRVALKLLSLGSLAPESVARFRREAESAGRLSHPNIVRVFGAGQEGSLPYYAMEFVEGESLASLLARGRVEPERVARLLVQAADALAYAHGQGIVHRDVKPANLLVGPADHVFIADFGLARDAAAATMTGTGSVFGTPAYMSPEQAKGLRREVDPRTDVYALGATLYESLAGRAVFEGETVADVLYRIINEEPRPISPRDRRCPPDLETIALKALEKERARRYASAGELKDDLLRFLAGEHIRARPQGWIGKGLRRARRYRAVLATAATIVTLAGLVGAAYAVHARAERARAARLAEADGLFEAGKLGPAIRAYSRLLEEAPYYELARLRRGRALAVSGSAREALEDLAAMQGGAGGSAELHLERGRLRLDLGDVPGALSEFSKALSLAGTDEARLAHAWALLAAKETGPADAEFGLVAEKGGSAESRAEGLCGQGAVAASLGGAQAARRCLERALAADPENGRAHFERGRLALQATDPSQETLELAEKDLAEAVRREKHGIAPLLEHARACHALLRDDQALDDCREAAERAPRDPRPAWAAARYAWEWWRSNDAIGQVLNLAPETAEARLLRGRHLLREGLPGAEEEFVAAAAGLANPAPALAGRAGCALAAGSPATALELAELAVAAEEREPECHGVRAEALERLGRIDEARAEFELCERLGPSRSADGVGLGRQEAMYAEFFAQSHPPSISELLPRAGAVVRAGDFILRLRPHLARAALLQARVSWLLGGFEDCLRQVGDALRRNPYLVDALVLRARVRTEVAGLRDLASARADAERATTLRPEEPRAWERLGRARAESGDAAGALEAYGRASALAPDLAVFHRRRAEALEALERKPEAEEAQARARALTRTALPDPRASGEYLICGHSCKERHLPELALALTTRALEEDARSSEALRQRSHVYESTGKFDLALLDTARAVEFDPRESVRLFCTVERKTSQMRALVAVFANLAENIVRRAPDDPAALSIRAFVLELLGRPDEALRDADRGLSLDPDFAVLLSFRGIVRYRHGSREAGLADLLEGARRAPEGGLPQYFLAQQAALAEEPERAKKLLARALALGFREYRDVVRRAKEFGSLRGDAEFDALLQEK